MRDESQLDDMRAAIRGDFERLAERRGGQELMRVDDELEGEPVGRSPEDEVLHENDASPPEAAAALDDQQSGQTEATAEIEAEPETEPTPEEPSKRRGLLARFFGL